MNEIDREALVELNDALRKERDRENAELIEAQAQVAALRDERDRLASATSLNSLDDAIDQLQSSWQKSGVTVPEMGLLIAGACKLRDYLRHLIESEEGQ